MSPNVGNVIVVSVIRMSSANGAIPQTCPNASDALAEEWKLNFQAHSERLADGKFSMSV